MRSFQKRPNPARTRAASSSHGLNGSPSRFAKPAIERSALYQSALISTALPVRGVTIQSPLGILALLGLLAEGAMADWGAVYLHDTLGSSPSVAALGFAAFSLAMAAGRFSGDVMVGRLGPRRVLRGSSAVAAVGLGAALLVGQPAVGVVGCALVGLGIANVIPVLFSAAARVPGVPPGQALAAVATTGYLGFLAGPPLIGVVAEAAGLVAGLGLVSGACAFVALKAGALPEAPTLRTSVTAGAHSTAASAVRVQDSCLAARRAVERKA